METVLTWAQQVVDLQQDDETAEEMQNLISDLAERFSITRNTITIEETEGDDGAIHMKITVTNDSEEEDLTEQDSEGNIVEFPRKPKDPGGTIH